MKHFLRIVITLVVLAVIGLSVYFIFFKPDSDLKTFTSLQDTIDKREKLGIDSKMNTLINANGHGKKDVVYYKAGKHIDEETEAEVVINEVGYDYLKENGQKIIVETDEDDDFTFSFNASDLYASIREYRNYLFYGGSVVELKNSNYIVGDDNIEITPKRYSYMVMEMALDDIFDSYFAYAQVCKNVKASAQKEMNKTIKAYNQALEKFNNQLESVLNYQLAYSLEKTAEVKTVTTYGETYLIKIEGQYDITSNANARTELTSRYYELINVYRELLDKYCDVINSLKSIVTNYVFDGELIIEAETVKLDLSLEAIKTALKTNEDENVCSARINLKLSDASAFINIQSGKEAFKNNSTNDEILSRYNNIVVNCKDDLVMALNLTNAEINLLVSNTDESAQIKAKFNQTYLEDIVYILKGYGFGVGA